MSMELTDSIKYFEKKIIEIAEKQSECSGGMGLSPDIFELTTALWILEGSAREDVAEFELYDFLYIVLQDKTKFELCFCNEAVLDVERDKGIYFAKCSQNVFTSVTEPRANRVKLEFLVALILFINRTCMDEGQKKVERDFKQVWSMFANLTPMTFLTIGMNLFYGFLSGMEPKSDVEGETVIRNYVDVIGRIVALAEDGKIHQIRIEFLDNYKQLFSEHAKHTANLEKQIDSNFTGLQSFGVRSEIDQEEYLYHLTFLEKIIGKYCEMYPSSIKDRRLEIMDKYRGLLLKRSPKGNVLINRWESKVRYSDDIGKMKETVREFCEEKKIFLIHN